MSLDIDPVLFVLDLQIKYTVEVIPLHTYIVWFVIVMVAPFVRSVGHVFAYLYTLDDNSECPMDFATSLLPKVFPLNSYLGVVHNLLPGGGVISGFGH